MNSFFNLDGPFYKWGTEVADVMILSILWLICSIPIFTIGASTTALFYVFGKKVRGEDPYVAKSFFKSFKENFKQSVPITILLGILWFSVYLYYQIVISGQGNIIVQVMGLFFTIQVIILSLYVFPVLSRFRMPIKNIIISSFVFGNRHLISSIVCAALLAGSLWIATYPTPFALFAFGLYALISSFLFQRIFTKYIEMAEEEEEKLKEEEKEKEDVEDNDLVEIEEEIDEGELED